MKKISDLSCVILCGGQSKRMGQDKALLAFSKQKSLSYYQYSRLEPYFDTCYLSAKTNKFDFEAKIIQDNFTDYSPLLALKNILETTKKATFIICVDTPFVSLNSIFKLYENLKTNDAIIARAKRTHYLCGIYSPKILPFINKNLELNNHAIRKSLELASVKYQDFVNEEEFMNVNTKEEYKKSLEFLEKI